MGWRMGLEPTTAGITIRDSTVELPPPLLDATARKVRRMHRLYNADARCESQAGEANKQCLAAAKADYDAAVAAAKAKKDTVHAAH